MRPRAGAWARVSTRIYARRYAKPRNPAVSHLRHDGHDDCPGPPCWQASDMPALPPSCLTDGDEQPLPTPESPLRFPPPLWAISSRFRVRPSGSPGGTISRMSYRGVEERKGMWAAFYNHGDHLTHLGLYATEEIAAHVHDLAVRRLGGHEEGMNFTPSMPLPELTVFNDQPFTAGRPATGHLSRSNRDPSGFRDPLGSPDPRAPVDQGAFAVTRV